MPPVTVPGPFGNAPSGPGSDSSGGTTFGQAFPFGVADRAGGTMSGQGVPDDFRQDFINALWEEGVDVSLLDPTQYEQFMEAAWSDPYLQNLYQGGRVSDITVNPDTGATVTNYLSYLGRRA